MNAVIRKPTDCTQPIPLERICRLSTYLSHACLGLIICLPIFIALSWFYGTGLPIGVTRYLDTQLSIENKLQLWQRFAGCAIMLTVSGLGLVGIWHVRRCFQLFSQGKFFNSTVLECLRHFSSWMLASVIASLGATPALSVLLTFYNAPGHRMLSLGFSSDQLFSLLVAFSVWVVAAVMSHANAIAEENARFL